MAFPQTLLGYKFAEGADYSDNMKVLSGTSIANCLVTCDRTPGCVNISWDRNVPFYSKTGTCGLKASNVLTQKGGQWITYQKDGPPQPDMSPNGASSNGGKPWLKQGGGSGWGGDARGQEQSLTCDPASYVTTIYGNSGNAIDSLTGLECRSTYDDSLYVVSTGRIGTSTGGGAGNINCGGSGVAGMVGVSRGMVGLNMLSVGSMETMHPVCKPWGSANIQNPAWSKDNEIKKGVGRLGKRQITWTNTCGADNVDDGGLYGTGPYVYMTGLRGYPQTKNGRVVGLGYYCKDLSTVKDRFRADNPDVIPKVRCCGNEDPNDVGCQDMKEAAAMGRPSFSCPAVMSNYCTGTDGKILNDANCKRYYADKTKTAEYARKLLEYCAVGTNIDTDACKMFCTHDTGQETDPPGFKAQCNQLYDKVCSDPGNHSLGICACHKPFSSYAGAKTILAINGPQELRCYDETCKRSGYYDQPQADYDCPQCLQNLSINVANATDTQIRDIKNTCNVTQGSPPPLPLPPPSGTLPLPPPPGPATPVAARVGTSDNPPFAAPLAVPLAASSPPHATAQSDNPDFKLYAMIGGGVLLLLVLIVVFMSFSSSKGGGRGAYYDNGYPSPYMRQAYYRTS